MPAAATATNIDFDKPNSGIGLPSSFTDLDHDGGEHQAGLPSDQARHGGADQDVVAPELEPEVEDADHQERQAPKIFRKDKNEA